MPAAPPHDGPPASEPVAGGSGSIAEVLLAFLKLGTTAFGGPVAHLGYFRDELVGRRGWIDEAGYGDLVALCQFLPGPASSQVAFTLGLHRSGRLLGGIVAWAAFSLPSALLLFAFAYGAGALSGPIGTGLVHGLKLVAVAVVAQAVWGMAKTLAPDRSRSAIAVAALTLALLAPSSLSQIAAILLGAVSGLMLCRVCVADAVGRLAVPISRPTGILALAAFVVLLVVPSLVGTGSLVPGVALFDAFYRSGALVFGGGHVVLPLLRSELVDPSWIRPDVFLAGYGAAQAVPGPLFTIAAYLGTLARPGPGGALGAGIALIALSLPGLLIVTGALPFWDVLRTRPLAQAAMRGSNAAVVGILGAALYDPVWTGAVLGPRDLAFATAAFVLLTVWQIAPWIVVGLTALGGVGLALLS